MIRLRFSPISGVGRSGPTLAGRFGPLYFIWIFKRYAVLIGNKVFSGFLDLFNAVFKDNKNFFCSDLIV